MGVLKKMFNLNDGSFELTLSWALLILSFFTSDVGVEVAFWALLIISVTKSRLPLDE